MKKQQIKGIMINLDLSRKAARDLENNITFSKIDGEIAYVNIPDEIVKNARCYLTMDAIEDIISKKISNQLFLQGYEAN